MPFEKEKKIYSRAASDVLIFNDRGEVLLTKRNIFPDKGKWVIPGGHVKLESPEDGARREIFEETGFRVELERLYGVYSNLDNPISPSMTAVYVGRIVGGEATKTIEVEEQKFFALENLPKKKEFGFNHYQVLLDFKKHSEGKPLS